MTVICFFFAVKAADVRTSQKIKTTTWVQAKAKSFQRQLLHSNIYTARINHEDPHSHGVVLKVVICGDVVEEGPAGIGLVQMRVGEDVSELMAGIWQWGGPEQ